MPAVERGKTESRKRKCCHIAFAMPAVVLKTRKEEKRKRKKKKNEHIAFAMPAVVLKTRKEETQTYIHKKHTYTHSIRYACRSIEDNEREKKKKNTQRKTVF